MNVKQILLKLVSRRCLYFLEGQTILRLKYDPRESGE